MKRPAPILFDESKTYLIALPEKGKKLETSIDDCKVVEAHLKNDIPSRSVCLYADGYEKAWFHDKLFEFLLYSGRIKIKE